LTVVPVVGLAVGLATDLAADLAVEYRQRGP
jgi:hypothetical protein